VDAGGGPADRYPQAEGLTWDELEELLHPLAAAEICGASVADLNSDKDPDGRFAGQISDLLARVLAG
jgi:arginase family enzyme